MHDTVVQLVLLAQNRLSDTILAVGCHASRAISRTVSVYSSFRVYDSHATNMLGVERFLN